MKIYSGKFHHDFCSFSAIVNAYLCRVNTLTGNYSGMF